MSPRSLRIVLLMAALAIAAAAPVAADLWYEHYARAEKALQNEDWSRAVEELNQALGKRGEPGARVRTYGMKVVAYFPYLKLGEAYFHLGQFDAALQAFETEERLGAIARSEEHLSELEAARRLVLAARQERFEEESRRVRQIVRGSLAEARRHEGEDELLEAVAVLSRALAVDPDNAEADSYLESLRTEIARREEVSELEARRANLVASGRQASDSGDFAAAASYFAQALDLVSSGEVSSLLASAQDDLRRQLESVESAGREGLIHTGLEAARSLETTGNIDQAIIRLQSVLALDPTNAEAIALQNRLLETRATSERYTARRETIGTLLEETQQELSAGHVENALSAANQVLALDRGNDQALAFLAAAYRRLNSDLLGVAPRQNIPPAIQFSNLRRDLEDGLQAERVTSPVFQLSGIVIDDSPVSIVFHDARGRAIEATDLRKAIDLEAWAPGLSTSEQSVGDIVITAFSLETRLGPGLSTFSLTATDSEELSTSSDYSVLYLRPFHRAPWFYALVAAVVILAAGVLFGRRTARRRSLRTRRFNPYVAGAPVIDEDLFFGRRDLINRILQTVHNNSLLLYGERRIGKTSIQHHLRRRLRELEDPDYEFFPAYVDLQGVPEERFFKSLADDVFEELEQDLDGLEPSNPKGADYSYRLLVRDLHAVIRALKARTDKRVKLVLLIDEVDELNDYDPRVNQRLRSLFMKSFAEQIVAVVSGVEIRKRWEREGSPWYNFFEELEVAPFHPEDARALIEGPIRGVFKVDEGVVERIVELTAGRPYLIQKMCMAVVSRMYEQQRDRITVADIEAVGSLFGEST